MIFRSAILISISVLMSACNFAGFSSMSSVSEGINKQGCKGKNCAATTPTPIPTVAPTATPIATATPTPTPSATATPITGKIPEAGDYPIIPSNFNVAQYLEPSTWGLPKDEGADDPLGAFRMACKPSHEGYNDPIVYPGQAGASHLHQFFGNTLTDHNSTYESLRTTGMSTCNGPLNRSAYWMPAMMNPRGQVVRPDFISVYYKRYPKTSPLCVSEGKACVDLPRGLRMVFGFNFKTLQKDDGLTFMHYMCKGDAPAANTWFPTLTEAAKGCPKGARIAVSLTAPECWDGVHLDSADHRSHMAYKKNVYDFTTQKSSFMCPTTHPYIIPAIAISPHYAVDDDVSSWSLSSDMMGATKTPGETFHADWFGAWDDGVMKTWMDNCIDKHLSCAGGELGDGSHMVFVEPFTDVAIPHVVEAPPMPASVHMSH